MAVAARRASLVDVSTALVVYATTHGHTARISGRIAEELRGHGYEVDLVDVAAADTARPADHDIVVVGGSVHAGHHQRDLVDWARRERDELAASGAAFFSVSLTAAEDTAEGRAATASMIDAFATDSGWTPTHAEPVAGALQYREYDFFTRTLMKLLMKRGGHSTDTSQDHDFTDWEAVARFARGLLPADGRAAG